MEVLQYGTKILVTVAARRTSGRATSASIRAPLSCRMLLMVAPPLPMTFAAQAVLGASGALRVRAPIYLL